MSAEAFSSYRFGEFEIDPRSRCVRRGAVEIALRRQAFEVLVYLVENRERVVSKAEMFENIWSGSAVTEDALVQCIVEIRRAMADDPKNPWFLRTVPRKGYRVIATPAGGSIVESQTIEFEDVRTLDVEIVASEPRRDMTSRFALGLGILAILGAIVAIAYTRRPEPTFPATRPVVAVVPFEASTSGDLGWLREGVADMLISGLARSKDLELISRQQLFEVGRRSGTTEGAITLQKALDLAAKSHANRLITGRLSSIGERIRIDAQVHDTTTGAMLGADFVITTRDRLLNDVQSLAASLGARLGAGSAGPELTDVMTANLDAYREYSIGVGYALATQQDRAIEQFEKAIALDPSFAMAWARIGYAHAVTYIDAGKARPYFAKALEFPERLDERARLQIAAWDAIARLDYASAIEHFRVIVARYPTETEGYLRLASLLYGELRLEESLRVLRAGLVVDPGAPDLYNALGGVYASQWKYPEAIAAHRRYVELLPDEPNAHDSLGLSYQRAGEIDKAIAEYRRAIELDPRFKIAVIHLGNTFCQMGRCRDAIREYERYLAMTPLSDSERARGYGLIAGALRRLGDFRHAEAVAREGMRWDGNEPFPMFFVHLASGDLEAAAGLRAALDQPWHQTSRGRRPNLRRAFIARALYAAKTGNEQEAIDYARKAMAYDAVYYDVDPLEDGFGDVLMILGRTNEAVAEYERAARANPALGIVRAKLAAAYEKAGRMYDAERETAAFLKLWEEADSEIPELVAARARVRRWSGPAGSAKAPG